MGIERMAIRYEKGTTEKNCGNCVYYDKVCELHDLPTSVDMKCGMHLPKHKKDVANIKEI